MNEVRAAVAGPTEGLVGRHKQFLEQARELNDMGPHRRRSRSVASHDRDPRLASDIEASRRVACRVASMKVIG